MAIQTRLAQAEDSVFGGTTAAEAAELTALYAGTGGHPLWFDAAGARSTAGRDVLAALNDASLDGLDPDDYRHDDIARRVDAAQPTAPEIADLDVAVSRATLRFMRHLHLGRIDPRTLGFKLRVPAEGHDFVAMLRAAHDDGRIATLVADLRPKLGQYDALRSQLTRYRFLAAEGEPVPSVPTTPTVKPGDAYPGLEALARRLTAFGDLPLQTASPLPADRYDGALVDAVMRFQVRHGLRPDGAIGKQTQLALNVSVATRVRQIEFALERLRWLPDLVDQGVLAINIPMFRLWAWSTNPPDGVPTLAMDVIVGRALGTETPVFDHAIRDVIFRPYWNVPRSIAVGEILPAIARDPGYLAKQDMELVEGASDGSPAVETTPENLARFAQGVLRVRQRPGPNNALGLVKFMFPNEDNVYLHGTPAQALFSRDRRDFSHGCVRVEDPVALAEWILRGNPEWTRQRIVAAMTGTEGSMRVALAQPVHIVLFYTTAVVNPENGAVHFAEDIYRHDARLERAMTSRRVSVVTP